MEETIPQEEPAPWPNKPWLNIWVKPRKTIRAIVDSDVKRYVFVLAILFGLIYCSNYLGFETNEPGYLKWKLAISLFWAAIVGLLRVYIGGIFVGHIGKALGGKGNIIETTASIAWMNIPALVIGIFLFSRVILYEDAKFIIRLPLNENSPITLVLLVLFILFYFWWQYIRVVCISEVQQFSIWKSMATLYVPVIIPLAIWASFVYFVLWPLTT